MKTDNYYGFFNHFVLRKEHKETLKNFGLNLQYKDTRFEVSSAHGAEALSRLIEPFDTQTLNENVRIERKELLGILNFLRRPIDSTLGADKKLGHHLSRFLTTGKADIPLYVDDALENAKSLDCHMKGQRKMQEDDAWRSEPEFANPKYKTEPEEEHVKLVSSVPNTNYIPEEGFVFNVAPEHSAGDFEGTHQKQLSSILWSALRCVKNDENLSPPLTEISFSATELRNFYEEIRRTPNLQQIITSAITEEKSQELYESVIQDAQGLANDRRFKQALEWQVGALSPNDKLQNLLLASSMLTPIVRSDAMYEAWKHSFFTEDWLKLTNPADDIPQQLDAFQMTVRKMLLTGQADAAHVQALVNNARPLLSFVSQVAESIEEGAKDRKGLTDEQQQRLINSMSNIQSAFNSASVNGVESGEAEGYYDELLRAQQNAFGQNGNALTQATVGSFNTWKGFWEGVVESVYDSPPAFAFLASLVTYAYITKYGSAPDPDTVQQAAEAVFSGWDGLDNSAPLIIDEQTIEMGRRAHEMIIANARGTGEIDEVLINPNVHYNRLLPKPVLDLMGGGASKYLQYRHWVGQNIIAGNAMTIQDLIVRPVEVAYNLADIPVNHSSYFKETSKAVTDTAGLIAVDANTFQDGSHATMLGFGIYIGQKYGLAARHGMLGLAAEFINPARRLVLPAIRPIQRSAAWLGGTTGIISPDTAVKITPAQKKDHHGNILYAAMDSVNTHAAFSFNLPEGIQEKNLPQALNNLALSFQHSADDFGVEAEEYKTFVLKHIEAVEGALNKASDTKAQKILQQSLPHVIGAELKFNGRDDIYTAILPVKEKKHSFLVRQMTDSTQTIDTRQRNMLMRKASKKHGRLHRKEQRAEFGRRARDAQITTHAPENLASVQSLKFAWDATKTGYTKLVNHSAQGINHGINAIIVGTRALVEEPICRMPLKKPIAKAATIMGASGVAMDMAGVHNIFTKMASGGAGAITSTANSSAIFMILNIPQDAALHTVAMATSIALGSAWYYSVNRGIKPIASGTAEISQAALKRISKRHKKNTELIID